jgi:cytochrome c-type biogenesis protein CcmH/NrfG
MPTSVPDADRLPASVWRARRPLGLGREPATLTPWHVDQARLRALVLVGLSVAALVVCAIAMVRAGEFTSVFFWSVPEGRELSGQSSGLSRRLQRGEREG